LDERWNLANSKQRQMTLDKAAIRQKLLDEILKTQSLIEEYREMTKPIAPDVAIGRISRMDAINNKSVTEAALRQSEEKLLDLQRVLSRINEKDFGLCLKCHKQIPLGRILIRPESLYCVNCAK
jgi:DnaK suppressor protein